MLGLITVPALLTSLLLSNANVVVAQDDPACDNKKYPPLSNLRIPYNQIVSLLLSISIVDQYSKLILLFFQPYRV